MRFRLERCLVLCFLLLVFSVVAPQVADWCRIKCQPPSGYGAVGDQRRIGRMPAAVRTAVEDRSGSEGSWVKEYFEGGSWVYELHVLKDRKWSTIRITSNGNVIRSKAQESESGDAVDAGG